MLEVDHLIILAVIALGLLYVAWNIQYGIVRGTLASVLRVIWVIPVFISFFPETSTESLPKTLSLKPLHVLLDDSDSMKRTNGGENPSEVAAKLMKTVENNCGRYGCIPKVTRLSELDDSTKNGFTPLSQVLEPWIYKVGGDPWLLISDGGDYKPTLPWDVRLKNTGRSTTNNNETRGLIVGFSPEDQHNVWVESASAPPFSFEDKPFFADVVIKRSSTEKGSELVQVQVLSGDQALATTNAEFKVGEDTASLSIPVSPMTRGQHLLTIKSLPTAQEVVLWDNQIFTNVEVLPNTVGVLHLLGSPSWDGRFLRRYLKSEPKYDLISFFILRDPWDSQKVSEREQSLIPFPVERLFKEELPNFRVVILQNFTLFQFLLPEYQNNLVQFVKDGGGLLFIGGPRALRSADLSSSPLKAILPFEYGNAANADDKGAGALDSMPIFGDLAQDSSRGPNPLYDPEMNFKIKLAQPESSSRALANVYDAWENLGEPLTEFSNGKGIHRMNQVKFIKDASTPLLNAELPSGETIPLAVASYPGKGRALWLFSDSFWRMAMSTDEAVARQSYHEFFHAAMTWLLREDLQKPLVAKEFHVKRDNDKGLAFSVILQGAAAKYFRPSKEWYLQVCGAAVEAERLDLEKLGSQSWLVKGIAPVLKNGGEKCTLTIEGQNIAFGSVKSSISAVVPETYADKEIGAVPHKLEELAKLTGAELKLPPTDPEEAVIAWIERNTGQNGVALPNRYKTSRDFYWIMSRSWIWLMLLAIPLEVIVRRWDKIFSGARKSKKSLPAT